jgi:uncharacterized protein YkwD
MRYRLVPVRTSTARLAGRLATCFAVLVLVGAPVAAQTLDAEEARFVQLINAYREQNGRAPLQVSVTLTNAAKWMSGDMAAKNYFSHTDSLGRNPFVRMKAFGYTYATAAGENIAAGNATAQATFEQWRTSSGHNQNMLSTSYTAIGIGRAHVASARYRYYWTTDFGGVVDQAVPTTPQPTTPEPSTPEPTPTFTLVPSPSDYDGDSKADAALWNPNTGSWRWLQSSNNVGVTQSLGAASDYVVTGDYDGDGRADPAVWRPATGVWSIKETMTGVIRTVTLGTRQAPHYDLPAPADYDGDGRTDVAVWRASTGYWYVIESGTEQLRRQLFAFTGSSLSDVPVPADYDGDRKADLAVWRPRTGGWAIRNSSTGRARVVSYGYGSAPYNDVPVAGDYDGDGKGDVAVWRTSTGRWYILESSTGRTRSQQWGSKGNGDVPAAADYDGDGRRDIAVWRSSTGKWLAIDSSTGQTRTFGF